MRKSPPPFTAEHRANLRKALAGRRLSAQHIKNVSIALTGKHLSDETKKKLSIINTGKILSEETRKKCGGMRGKTHTADARKRISESHKGKNHYRWNPNRIEVENNRDGRNTTEYKEWRMRVWMRDGFKCRIANKQCSGDIEAHHILSFTKYPELKHKINNGITLCHAHHPRKRAEEQRLIPTLQGLVEVTRT